jgi:branched-chain amino acid transport system substrate-binding protein
MRERLMPTRVFLFAALYFGLIGGASAQQLSSLKIGVLNDMSGPYSEFQGDGSLIAARMAAEDFSKSTGLTVEVLSADNQNKPDIGLAIARKWFDIDAVDLLVDGGNSAIALAVSNLAREKNRVFVTSAAGTSELTGKQCSPNTIQWTYDTWSLSHGLVKALMANGFKTWFFITADYAFGKDLEQNATSEIVEHGGKVLGSVRHPVGVSDFASYLLQAQNSGAQVIALANAGADVTNVIKQASEFGIDKRQRIAGMILNVTHIPSLGLEATQGVSFLSSFYWDMNDDTRAFSARFAERHARHNMPNDMQAGVYSAVLHYLKSVQKSGNASDGRRVVEMMKSLPTNDPIFGSGGTIRADGRKLHPIYLLETKRPSDSKSSWDVAKVMGVIPAEGAFRSMKEGNCFLTSK